MARVIAYVDGFNLYHGLKKARWEKYLWLDIQGLLNEFIENNETLLSVKYYTSRIRGEKDKKNRQKNFLKAQEMVGNINVIYGKYAVRRKFCRTCGQGWRSYEEKKTDTNLATDMVLDACLDEFDVALLLGGDSDMVPPVNQINNNFPTKSVRLLVPPARRNQELISLCSTMHKIKEKHLQRNQFADKLILSSDLVLTRPKTWSDLPRLPHRKRIIPYWLRKLLVYQIRKVLVLLDAGYIK